MTNRGVNPWQLEAYEILTRLCHGCWRPRTQGIHRWAVDLRKRDFLSDITWQQQFISFPNHHVNPAVVQVLDGGIVNYGSPSKGKHTMVAMFNNLPAP